MFQVGRVPRDLRSPSDLLSVMPPSELPAEEIRSERQKSRLKKRRALNDHLNNTREDLFSGGFDRYVHPPPTTTFFNSFLSLIVATEYDPLAIIDRLSSYLGGSASIVVHSPYIQVPLLPQMPSASANRFIGCGRPAAEATQ